MLLRGEGGGGGGGGAWASSQRSTFVESVKRDSSGLRAPGTKTASVKMLSNFNISAVQSNFNISAVRLLSINRSGHVTRANSSEGS